MSEKKEITEGKVIVIGLLIFMVCLAGSVVTQQSPIVVFCVGLLAITLTTIICGLFIITCVRLYKALEAIHREDSKVQMFQEDDDWRRLKQDCETPDSHTKESAKELQQESAETSFLAKYGNLTDELDELKGYLKYFWSRVRK